MTIIAASVDSIKDMKLVSEGKRFPNREKEINAQSYKNFNLRLENVKTIINHFFDVCKNKKIIGQIC